MGVYDYKAAKKTNKTNMAINQANIDYAWKALNTQNDFNVQQQSKVAAHRT
jgi:hypothetical protein